MAGVNDVNRYPVIHTWSYKLAEGRMIQTKETLTWVTLKRVRVSDGSTAPRERLVSSRQSHHVVIRHNNTASNNN